MTPEAETALSDVLEKFGKSICETPRMLEMMLRQQPKVTPEEADALMAAVKYNVVRHLIADPRTDQAALTETLTVQGQQPTLVAKWAVEAWSRALGGVRQEPRVHDWNGVGKDKGIGAASTAIARWALIGMGLVSLSGAAGGTLPGIWIGTHLLARSSAAQQLMEQAGIAEAKNPMQFMLIYCTLGGLAGFVGAGLGWMVGGKTRMTPGRVMGAMIGAFWASINGAYFGMINGEGVGTFIGCVIGTGIGTFIATMMGVLVVLLVLGQLAYFILAM